MSGYETKTGQVQYHLVYGTCDGMGVGYMIAESSRVIFSSDEKARTYLLDDPDLTEAHRKIMFHETLHRRPNHFRFHSSGYKLGKIVKVVEFDETKWVTKEGEKR